MVEDILNTPGQQLLEEVAQEHGRPEALALELDRIIGPTLVQHGRESEISASRHGGHGARVSAGNWPWSRAPHSAEGRVRERIGSLLTQLIAALDPVALSPALRGAALVVLVVVAVGVPVGITWLPGEQPRNESEQPLGKSRGIGRMLAPGDDAKTARPQANFFARLLLSASEEDLAAAKRAADIFADLRQKYPTLVTGESQLFRPSRTGCWRSSRSQARVWRTGSVICSS